MKRSCSNDRMQNFIHKFARNVSFLTLALFPYFNPLFSQDSATSSSIVELNDSLVKINEIIINRNSRTVTFPARIKMTKGLIEVLLCKPQGKTHESLFVTDISHIELQTALLLLGLMPFNNSVNNVSTLKTNHSREFHADSLMIFVEWKDSLGCHNENAEYFVWNKIREESLPPSSWLFQGLPIIDDKIQTSAYFSMIVTYDDPFAVLVLNSPDKNDDRLFYVNEKMPLTSGMEVQIILETYKL